MDPVVVFFAKSSNTRSCTRLFRTNQLGVVINITMVIGE